MKPMTDDCCFQEPGLIKCWWRRDIMKLRPPVHTKPLIQEQPPPYYDWNEDYMINELISDETEDIVK